MSFMLLPNWEKLNEDIWNSIDTFPSTPKDIYVDLLRSRLLRIGGKKELGKPKNLEALNDEQKAKDRFRTLGPPESEEACVSIIIEYYNILRQFEKEISDKYMEDLRTWLDKSQPSISSNRTLWS